MAMFGIEDTNPSKAKDRKRLFLLDQNTGKYLALQEKNERRFHGMKLDWGFDQFLSLKAFTDTSNGFLMEDACVFGAEVFVRKEKSMQRRVYINDQGCRYVQACLEN
ncbi:PREDICTED: MATH [Prunus dulcis]|uniref:PREDICTED: MATH n=1 Tax=Prunus dulcis TaxID=3755 RepID=A0A5E4GIY9_PRUDU|nr:PREDICTED: MATH [Prunus dulcis]